MQLNVHEDITVSVTHKLFLSYLNNNENVLENLS